MPDALHKTITFNKTRRTPRAHNVFVVEINFKHNMAAGASQDDISTWAESTKYY